MKYSSLWLHQDKVQPGLGLASKVESSFCIYDDGQKHCKVPDGLSNYMPASPCIFFFMFFSFTYDWIANSSSRPGKVLISSQKKDQILPEHFGKKYFG